MVEWSGYRLGALVVGALVCAHANSQPRVPIDEVTLVYEYVWGLQEPAGNVLPLRIQIDNPLSNDRGVIQVTNGTYSMQYPVELPAKSLRSFVVYIPVSNGYFETKLRLDCRQAHIELPLNSPGGSWETYDYGLISEVPSLMQFLVAKEIKRPGAAQTYGETDTTSARSFFVKPGAAPDRAIGYDGIDLLVLGEGCERLTDGEVSAIQRYVLGGGTVLMTGGAVAPILRDQRWAAFVPGTQPRVVNMEGSQVLSRVTGVPMSSVMTVTQITPAEGTTGLQENGVPILWYRKCGMGMVVYWAFDPFLDPIRTYRGRTSLFTDTVSALDNNALAYMTEIGLVDQNIEEYGYGGYPGAYPGYQEDTGSVFRVQMPSTSKLFIILGCYFIIVVPVNFLVLNKLGRGQMAWVTSPLVGLAFAGAFFYVARDLYATNLSRSTNALVVAHEGASTAYVVGRQQMFFPNAGHYDLGFKGVEAVTTSSDYGMYYGGGGTDTGFSGDLVDVGQVVAPRATVSNLAFREFQFNQGIEWKFRLPLHVETTREGDLLRVKGELTNDTPYDIDRAKLYVEGREVGLGNLPRGGKAAFNEAVGLSPVLNHVPGAPPASKGLVVFTGQAKGLDVGTSLGEEKGAGTTLLFTYSSVTAGGQK